MTNGIYEFKKEDAFSFASAIGYKARERGNELQFAVCPYCKGGRKTDKPDKNTFAINLTTGAFNCKRASCGVTGNMITLSKDFRDYGFKLGGDADVYYNTDSGNYRTFRDAHKKIESRDKAIEYLKSRGISEETTRKYEVTTDSNNDKIIIFPFRDASGALCFWKYRNIDPERTGSKEWCLGGDGKKETKKVLFGMAQCDPEQSKTLIITEGQIDSLSVAECGIPNAVSVPLGKNGFTWIPHCWNFVNKFKEIVVFGDKEGDEITLLETIRKRFGRKMCIKSVRLEDYGDCKDANDILRKFGKERIQQCIERAEQSPVKRVKQISSVKMSALTDQKYLPTGIRQIDKCLGGGLPFGGVTVLTGKAGEGKSTLCSQIILMAADKGMKVFSYSGELPATKFKEWMYLQAAGVHHSEKFVCNEWGDESYRLTPGAETKIDAWLHNRCFYYDYEILEDEEEDKVLTDTIEDAINQYGIDVVVLDNLMTAMYLNRTEGCDTYDVQSKFVHRITKMAMKYGIVVILVAHKKKNSEANGNDDIAGTANIGNLASTIISFGKTGNQEDEDVRSLKVTKNRMNGKTVEIKTRYEESTRRIYFTDAEKNYCFEWQNMEVKKALDDYGIEYMTEEEFQEANMEEIPF